MSILYWVCFGVGAGYTAIAFILGGVVGEMDLDAEIGFGGGASPLKPSVVAVFITVFGGVGLLMQNALALPAYVVVPTAATVGAAAATAILRFVIIPLKKAQNTSAVDIQSLIGHSAKVTEKIFQGGYGQITYVAGGNSHNSPAKSSDGSEIARGETVEIQSIEDNTYFVRKK